MATLDKVCIATAQVKAMRAIAKQTQLYRELSFSVMTTSATIATETLLMASKIGVRMRIQRTIISTL